MWSLIHIVALFLPILASVLTLCDASVLSVVKHALRNQRDPLRFRQDPVRHRLGSVRVQGHGGH